LESLPEIEYKPIPVKELLMEMKNLSELMVNLAYYSILYHEEELAKEVFRLESRVDYLELLLTMQAALATRSIDDAEKIASIYKLASASNKISDAAADIAKITLSKIHIPSVATMNVYDSNEIVSYLTIPERSPLDGYTLKNLFDKYDIIFDVLTVRRGNKWIFKIDKDFVIRGKDFLIVRGPIDNISYIRNILGMPPISAEMEKYEEKYRPIIEQLTQFKNTSQFMVDLAYTSLLTRSYDIAEKVVELEDYIDRMLDNFEEAILKYEDLSVKERAGFLRVAIASEEISDAAADLSEILLRGIEPHPLITDILEESDERISVIEMDETDEGKTLVELGYARKGVIVLAVRRGDEWHIMPPYTAFKVKNGDILLVKYYSESEEFIEKLEKEEDREEMIEEIQEEEWEEEE